jgi:ABC-type transport system involved in multi-copper enzyme maturation permease subunit
MGHIFRRELLDQLTSFKFAAGLLLMLILSGINGAVFSFLYKNDSAEYRQVQRRWESQLAERKKLDDLPHQVFDVLKTPLKTAFLASGGQDRLPNEYYFTINIWGEMPGTRRAFSQNVLIESFKAVDWSFLVGTAFSLLALVFVYDSVSGEKAQGTLKLLQTYSLSRNSILFGKLLANLATLLVMLLAGMLLSLILLLSGGVEIGPAELARAGLFLLLSLFYITLFLSIGFFLSTVTHRPTAAMVLAVMVWVVSIVVIPGAGTLIVQQVHKLPTTNEIWENSGRVWRQVDEEFQGESSTWRGREMGKVDNYLSERRSTVAQNRRKHLQEEIWSDYLRQKFQQAKVVRQISSVSPTGLFESGAESVNGAGVLRDELLVAQSHQYRSTLEEWVRQRDLADPASPHLCFQPGYLSLASLQTSSVPRFTYHEPSVSDGLRDALWRVVLLAAETLVMLFAAVFAFQRYDVR